MRDANMNLSYAERLYREEVEFYFQQYVNGDLSRAEYVNTVFNLRATHGILL